MTSASDHDLEGPTLEPRTQQKPTSAREELTPEQAASRAFDEERGAEDPATAFLVESGAAGLSPGSDEVTSGETRVLESLLYGPEGAGFAVNVGEGGNWQQTGGVSHILTDHYERQKMARYLWWLYQVADPTFRNIVNLYAAFVVGDGAKVEIRDPAKAEKWKKMARRIGWGSLVKKIVRSQTIFGEVFLVRFPLTVVPGAVSADGTMVETAGREQAGGMTLQGRAGKGPMPRLLNSWDVNSIISQKGDPENVLWYVQEWAEGGGMSRRGLAPEDVWHFRNDPLPNLVRTSPPLLPVLEACYYYRAFIKNRHWLNMVRSRVPLTITRKGGGAGSMAAMKAAYSKLPSPGSVWFLAGVEKVEFPALNIGAADARDDAKQILRTVAQGASLPEFMVTGDTSSTNYSSAVVAENPSMRIFTDQQETLELALEEVVADMLGIDPDDVGVDLPPVSRNLDKLIKSFSLMLGDEVISRQSYAERVGINWEGPDGEKARIEAERVEREDLGLGFKPKPNPGDGPERRPDVDPTGPGGEAGSADPGEGRATPPGDGNG